MLLGIGGLAAATLIGLVGFEGTSSATTFTCAWTGATSTSMSVAGNWSGCNSAAPTTGDVLVFPNTANSNQPVDDLGAGFVADSIQITGEVNSGTPYAITPATNDSLVLSPSTPPVAITVAAAAGNPTIAVPITFTPSSGTTSEVAAASGANLTFIAALAEGGATGDTVQFGDSSNTGSVTLQGASPSLGAAVAGGGAVMADGSTTLGPGALTVDSGATLTLADSGGQTYANPITLGSGGSGAATLEDVASDTWSGNITLDPGTSDSLQSDSGSTFTVTGQVTGGGTGTYLLAASGNGTLELSNATNNYVATTEIQSETLKAGAASVLPATTDVDLSGLGELDLNGFNQTVASINDSGPITSSTGSASLTVTLDHGGSPINPDTFLGNITGSVALDVSGLSGSMLELTGSGDTYTGGTTVSSGALETTSSTGFGSGSVAVASGQPVLGRRDRPELAGPGPASRSAGPAQGGGRGPRPSGPQGRAQLQDERHGRRGGVQGGRLRLHLHRAQDPPAGADPDAHQVPGHVVHPQAGLLGRVVDEGPGRGGIRPGQALAVLGGGAEHPGADHGVAVEEDRAVASGRPRRRGARAAGGTQGGHGQQAQAGRGTAPGRKDRQAAGRRPLGSHVSSGSRVRPRRWRAGSCSRGSCPGWHRRR